MASTVPGDFRIEAIVGTASRGTGRASPPERHHRRGSDEGWRGSPPRRIASQAAPLSGKDSSTGLTQAPGARGDSLRGRGFNGPRTIFREHLGARPFEQRSRRRESCEKKAGASRRAAKLRTLHLLRRYSRDHRAHAADRTFRRKDLTEEGSKSPSCRRRNNGTEPFRPCCRRLGRAYPQTRMIIRTSTTSTRPSPTTFGLPSRQRRSTRSAEPDVSPYRDGRGERRPTRRWAARVKHTITRGEASGSRSTSRLSEDRVPDEGGVIDVVLKCAGVERRDAEQLLQFVPTQRATLRQSKKKVSDQYSPTPGR